MRLKLLFLFVWMLGIASFTQAQNDCDADTSYFKLPQNEFNRNNPWYFNPSPEQGLWAGGLNYYDMYDPCVAKNNTLIITEVNLAAGNYGTFMELTNVGDQPVDLGPYRIIGQRNDRTFPGVKTMRMGHLELSGTVEPGESYIVMGAFWYDNITKGIMDRADSLHQHNTKLEALASITYPINTGGSSFTYLLGRGIDMLGTTAKFNYTLAKVIGDTAEVIVDVFEQSYSETARSTIAGIPDASAFYTIVRKQFTNGRTYGSSDFKITSGAEAAEASEWIVLPRFRNGTSHLPTTIGSHNPNSQYALAAKDGSGVTIDENAGIIYLPWGTYKNDSIISALNVGADMAWEYLPNNVTEELVSNLAHTGDSVTFYHCGVDVTIKDYKIIVNAPSADASLAICKNRKSDLNRMYNETQGLSVDTIYGRRLTFDYPADTLLYYVEVADNATKEIIWKDGDDPRPTLKNGDILRVTANDKSTHDYYIGLVSYENDGLSYDSRLSAITWPDYPIDELDPYIWSSGDTIPGYNKDAYSYILNLPAETTQIPALKATCYNARASFHIESATNLYGSVEDQTTTIVVKAENDTIISKYTIRFIVEKEDWDYEAEPFFSEVARNNSKSIMLEVCNPGNTLLDLSDYVVVHGKYAKKTLPEVFGWDGSNFFNNTKVYRPGYVYDSLTMVSNQTMWFDPNGDSDVDSYVEPKGVFTIATEVGGGAFDTETGLFLGEGNGIIDGPNVLLHGNSGSRDWSYNKHGGSAYGIVGRLIYSRGKTQNMCNTFWLLKILNDSVKDGTKGVSDAADFEVIDIIGKVESGETYGWMIPSTGAPLKLAMAGAHIRKPEINKGNPVSMGSFGYANIETSGTYDAANPVYGDVDANEWDHVEQSPFYFDFGRHVFNPVTSYKANISSTVYKASLGITMNEAIFGVEDNTQGSTFIQNIIKYDEGQQLQLSTSGGALIFDFDILQEGDMLTVTSADGVNQAAYTIHIGALNSDVSLTSSTYEVTESVVKLTAVDITIKEMIENLSVNALSTLYVTDASEGLAAHTAFNFRDSSYYDVPVSGDLKVKVTSQSGATKLYSVALPSTSADAFLTSNLYAIDNTSKHVNGVYNGTNVEVLLNNLVPCEGATATVVNKWSQDKDFGILLFNDVVKVVSADGTKTVFYGITLNSEVEPEITLTVPETPFTSSAKTYPNPTTGKVNFNSEFKQVEVYDITGKLIKTVKGTGSQIDISSLYNGLYILSVTGTDDQTFTVKLTKQ